MSATYRKSGRTLARLRNSTYGNPRWRVTFDDGTVFDTAPDAQVGYSIGNPEFNGDVVITVDGRGRIVGIEPMHGYVCKRCGGPSPAGVGHVDSTPGAADRSAALPACGCGHSVAP